MTTDLYPDLNDNDFVMRLGTDKWDRVGDLRAAARGDLRTAGWELRTNISTEDDDVNHDSDTPVPNGYEPHLAQLRAANDARASTFEKEWRAKRAAEFDAEHRAAELRAASQPAPRVLTADELAKYRAPDPYAAGLKALQEKALQLKAVR